MKKYWKDIDSKQESTQAKLPEMPGKDQPSLLSMFDNLSSEGSSSRRDFLKLCGFSFAVSAMASCQTKVRKAIPYVVAPYEITPGEANYYASTFMDGSDYCSIIVKTREGRPIKIEGNPESKISQGGTSARVQASVMELYDTRRYQSPEKEGVPVEWESADAEIQATIQQISDQGGTIVLLTPTLFSPSTKAVISQFTTRYPGTEWMAYDAISASAIRDANKESFGKAVIPDYRFDLAKVIVSLGADFLGTWLSPVEYTKQFSSGRNPDKEMNHLIQIESNLSITGSNADKRIQIKPSHEAAVLMNIYKKVISAVEGRTVNAPSSPVDVSEVSKKLLASRGKSLVVSASNDVKIQKRLFEKTKTLGNHGSPILMEAGRPAVQGLESVLESLTGDLFEVKGYARLVGNEKPGYT